MIEQRLTPQVDSARPEIKLARSQVSNRCSTVTQVVSNNPKPQRTNLAHNHGVNTTLDILQPQTKKPHLRSSGAESCNTTQYPFKETTTRHMSKCGMIDITCNRLKPAAMWGPAEPCPLVPTAWLSTPWPHVALLSSTSESRFLPSIYNLYPSWHQPENLHSKLSNTASSDS